MTTDPPQTSLNPEPEIRYTVRRSTRARYMRINARRDKGIEVVIPKRMALKHVEPFVRQHRQWIRQQIEQLALDRPVKLPTEISLAAISEVWSVEYRFGDGGTWRCLEEYPNRLLLKGPVKNTEACVHVLHRWLRKQARKFLPALLYEVSRECGLNYQKVSVRTQKSRWGSCSSEGNISLNDRLMLLPYELVKYVLIHELCHTRHMNHSRAFWSLVERYSLNHKDFDTQLRRAQRELPAWV